MRHIIFNIVISWAIAAICGAWAMLNVHLWAGYPVCVVVFLLVLWFMVTLDNAIEKRRLDNEPKP